MWGSLKNYSDGALLFLRITLGTFYIYVQGWGNLFEGTARWRSMGMAMKHIGIIMAPTFWGFTFACAESVGCVLLIIGFLFRPSCLWLALTMLVVSLSEFTTFKGSVHASALHASHTIELMLVFFALMFIGPGRFSVDKG